MSEEVYEEIVVLGMHRSGTSLVAQIADALGVFMGNNLVGANRFNPHGHWEDVDFYNLNLDILRSADGDWLTPPPRDVIVDVGRWYEPEIAQVVYHHRKQSPLWGWKDPRNSLTCWLYHEHLRRPLYVRSLRKRETVIQSLEHRAAAGGAGRGFGADWEELYDIYEGEIEDFEREIGHVTFPMHYERLTRSEESARPEIERLASKLDAEDRVDEALARIDFELAASRRESYVS